MNIIHQRDIRFSYPEQHFFRQQAAYVFNENRIQTDETTKSSLLLQKKHNMLLYIKFRDLSLHALLTLGSLPQKHYKTHYTAISLSNLPDLSTDHSLTFAGVDNKLYIAYHFNNDFRIVRILDGATVYELPGFKEIGVGLPLYNNFIPIVALTDNTLIVMLYDIKNNSSHKIANYSIQFLEKQLVDYINKLISRDISSSIIHYRESYRILEPYRFTDATAGKSFEICTNLSVCGTVLYISNMAVNESTTKHVVFEMKFKVRNQKLYYEFSIPSGMSFKWLLGVKTPTKYIIETKTLNIRLSKGNYTAANILYYRSNILILKDFVYNDSYYILDLKKHIKHKISNNYVFRNSIQFYIVNNLIMIVYFASFKFSQGNSGWHLMIYDTIKRRFLNTLIKEWHEREDTDLVSYYYVEKCQKAVFIIGTVKNNYRDFYNLNQNRTIHMVSVITILDLSKISNIIDKEEIENCKEVIKFPRWVEKYLETKESRGAFVNCVQADCTVDTKNAMLYITAFVPDYKNPVITVAKNLCERNTKFYNFDLGIPILRTRDLTKDKTKPLYISSKTLAKVDYPKYIHIYDWKGFYNFANSKTINTGLIFIAYPHFLIIDRRYYRVTPFYKEFSDLYLTESLLIDDWLVGYCMIDRNQTRLIWLAGLFIINDLIIVRQS
jgi:hypothetical protein